MYITAEDHLRQSMGSDLIPKVVRLGNSKIRANLLNLMYSKYFFNIFQMCVNILKYFIAFHDCVGPDGCDGCVNMNNTANKGLQEIIEFLDEERKENFPVIYKLCLT